MPFSRRKFLTQASHLSLAYGTHPLFQMGMGATAKPKLPNAPDSARPMLNGMALKPFVDRLQLPRMVRPVHQHGKQVVTLSMQEVHAKVHRDLPRTRMWTYGSGPLAPLIEVRGGEALEMHWHNNLPTKHFLPIDHSLHGCGRDVPEVRAIAHLHGAKTHSHSDGYPEDWFVPGKSLVSRYPMQQDATALWYHDHAMGINRLNVYAGLFGMLLICDKVEDKLNLRRARTRYRFCFMIATSPRTGSFSTLRPAIPITRGYRSSVQTTSSSMGL